MTIKTCVIQIHPDVLAMVRPTAAQNNNNHQAAIQHWMPWLVNDARINVVKATCPDAVFGLLWLATMADADGFIKLREDAITHGFKTACGGGSNRFNLLKRFSSLLEVNLIKVKTGFESLLNDIENQFNEQFKNDSNKVENQLKNDLNDNETVFKKDLNNVLTRLETPETRTAVFKINNINNTNNNNIIKNTSLDAPPDLPADFNASVDASGANNFNNFSGDDGAVAPESQNAAGRFCDTGTRPSESTGLKSVLPVPPDVPAVKKKGGAEPIPENVKQVVKDFKALLEAKGVTAFGKDWILTSYQAARSQLKQLDGNEQELRNAMCWAVTEWEKADTVTHFKHIQKATLHYQLWKNKNGGKYGGAVKPVKASPFELAQKASRLIYAVGEGRHAGDEFTPDELDFIPASRPGQANRVVVRATGEDLEPAFLRVVVGGDHPAEENQDVSEVEEKTA